VRACGIVQPVQRDRQRGARQAGTGGKLGHAYRPVQHLVRFGQIGVAAGQAVSADQGIAQDFHVEPVGLVALFAFAPAIDLHRGGVHGFLLVAGAEPRRDLARRGIGRTVPVAPALPAITGRKHDDHGGKEQPGPAQGVALACRSGVHVKFSRDPRAVTMCGRRSSGPDW
jgi:hypothetical protein